MTSTVQPKASSSMPFFKSSSFTSTQAHSNKNNRTVVFNVKQRKRSLTTFEVSPNTARKADFSDSLHDKNTIALLALKTFKKYDIPKEPTFHLKKGSDSKSHTHKNTSREQNQSSLKLCENTTNANINFTSDSVHNTCNTVNNTCSESLSALNLTESTTNQVSPISNKKEAVSDHYQVSTYPLSSISSQIISSSKSLLKKSMDTSKEEAKKRSVSLLQRTRSRKWSNPISESKNLRYSWKNGPTAFMSSPVIPKCLEANQKFLLMHRLLKSMTLGGYVTDSLHVPMDVWFQPNVRLSYLEAKVAASELIIVVLEKMDARNSNDINLNAVSSELKVLKQTLNQINETLRKMGCSVPEIIDKEKQASNRYSTNRTSQTIIVWSAKLTKSVEKMRLEATRSSTPNEEQNRLYIMTLIRLFTKAKILEYWDIKLKLMIDKEGVYGLLAKEVYKISSECISHFMSIFCSLALKDCETLISKWFKQSMIWMDE